MHSGEEEREIGVWSGGVWSGGVWSGAVGLLVPFLTFLPRALPFPFGVEPGLGGATLAEAVVGVVLEDVAKPLFCRSLWAKVSPTTVRENLPQGIITQSCSVTIFFRSLIRSVGPFQGPD